jgi:hypothetical protein
MSNPPSGFGRGGRGAALAQLLNQQVRRPGDQLEGIPQQPTAFGGTQSQLSTTVFGAAQTQQFTGTSVVAPKHAAGESTFGIQQQLATPVGQGQMQHGAKESCTQQSLPVSSNVSPSSSVPSLHSSVAAPKPVELQPVSCLVLL